MVIGLVELQKRPLWLLEHVCRYYWKSGKSINVIYREVMLPLDICTYEVPHLERLRARTRHRRCVGAP